MAHPATVIDGEEIARIVDAHSALEGPLLPMLHALQEAFGHVPAQAHAPICDALNITRAELHGVITFYHDFREKPAGRHVLKICRAEACQSVGGAAVADALLAKLGLEWHGTTSDGAVTIEPVYCLGMCACGPAAMVDDRVVGRVDAAKLEKLLAEVGA
ncbi:MAG: formate dehydrogenase subunit gamma [Rhodobacteraceae bacterium]|jgi:formate dehydrogenase gamma subunit (EC 1.2.1.2)|uniref:Formate dehydrogenase subunit gamma n=1 Tax=Thioclava marina TaxID=1915077 RepID=A0ABX3MMB5_9RHOB|nr:MULTISPECIES: formate dehydrogenase subunit gamma [Thioclava]MBD3802529.1 formate dehydrogenase subunit gamma [Thioclava sp.]OOY12685.1 formate dehydrogenase subunit gamma [Thioclava marina]TNF10980.1 MAG: formate dehydrogenase subunit gamma [Paracoccaceae bacterium]